MFQKRKIKIYILDEQGSYLKLNIDSSYMQVQDRFAHSIYK